MPRVLVQRQRYFCKFPNNNYQLLKQILKKMAPLLNECESCRALFRQKEELEAHLSSSPNCKMISQQRRYNPNAFTAELDCLGKLKTLIVSETVPDTIVNDGSGRLTNIRGRKTSEEDSLLAAMESGMKKSAPGRVAWKCQSCQPLQKEILNWWTHTRSSPLIQQLELKLLHRESYPKRFHEPKLT